MTDSERNVQVNPKSNPSVRISITTNTGSTTIDGGLELNPSYFKTIPGFLKIIQLILGIICMACGSPAIFSYVNFFMFVVAIYFIFTILYCLVYFFTLRNLIPKVPWLIVELLGTIGAVVLYGMASIIQLANTSKDDDQSHYWYFGGFHSAYIAAGVMGLFNTIAYAVGLVFLFMDYRRSSRAAPNAATNDSAS